MFFQNGITQTGSTWPVTPVGHRARYRQLVHWTFAGTRRDAGGEHSGPPGPRSSEVTSPTWSPRPGGRIWIPHGFHAIISIIESISQDPVTVAVVSPSLLRIVPLAAACEMFSKVENKKRNAPTL